eukprot:14653346-Alexandrium_andersonii.AAC.1
MDSPSMGTPAAPSAAAASARAQRATQPVAQAGRTARAGQASAVRNDSHVRERRGWPPSGNPSEHACRAQRVEAPAA